MNDEITIVKPKSRLNRIFYKFVNFFCALIIFFAILFSIGAFIQADVESKNILGNHDYQIFSYNKTDDGTAVFKAFGESFILDLNKVDSVIKRFDEISRINQDYTPYVITLSGDVLTSCFSSVIESFGKIPEIISYYLE